MISGYGQETTKLVIVSDYPTKEEALNGYALVGKAGGLIEGFLKPAFKLDQTYRTLLIKDYVAGAETKNKHTRNALLQSALQQKDYAQILANEIAQINPNVILALGELTLNTLTGVHGINKYRGSILPYVKNPRINVVSTFHPRQIWEMYSNRPILQFDVNRAVGLRDQTEAIKNKELIWICRNYNSLANWWERAQKGEYLTVDVETWFNFISCIGFCHDGYEAISIPLFGLDTPTDQLMVFRLIDNILRSKIPKVNQNIGFDLIKCNRYGWRIENIMDDTMLLAHSCYPEFPKNLGFLVTLHTTFPYHKNEGKEFNPFVGGEGLLIYNAKDALTDWQVYKSQVADAKELKIWNFHRQQVWPLFTPYIKMQERGIRRDEERMKALLNRYTHLYNLHLTNLEEAYGGPINLGNAAIGKLVYEELKCPPKYHYTERGKKVYDTDKETLENLYINEVKSPEIRTILKEIIITRKIQTIRSYILMVAHPDKRLRTSFNLAGTKSGRTSGTTSSDRIYLQQVLKSGKTKIIEVSLGGSFQVIPKRAYEAEEFEGEVYGTDIPSMFVPSPGYCFVEGDGSQAEARVVCVLAQSWDTLTKMDRVATKKNQYGVKDDYHTETVTLIMGIPFTDVKKTDRENYGKRPRHAGNYDMGAYRLSHMVYKPMRVCEEILRKFHGIEPNIRLVFHAEVKRAIYDTGMLRSPQGRIRQFFDRRDDKLFKMAYSQIPQATVSDHTKGTVPLLSVDLPDAHFLCEKHDSLLAEVPLEQKDDFCSAFKRHYERPIAFQECTLSRDFQLVIPAEIKWSETSWAEKDMTEWKGN